MIGPVAARQRPPAGSAPQSDSWQHRVEHLRGLVITVGSTAAQNSEAQSVDAVQVAPRPKFPVAAPRLLQTFTTVVVSRS